MEELLRKGASPNAIEPRGGRTALRLALQYGVSARKVLGRQRDYFEIEDSTANACTMIPLGVQPTDLKLVLSTEPV